MPDKAECMQCLANFIPHSYGMQNVLENATLEELQSLYTITRIDYPDKLRFAFFTERTELIDFIDGYGFKVTREGRMWCVEYIG